MVHSCWPSLAGALVGGAVGTDGSESPLTISQDDLDAHPAWDP